MAFADVPGARLYYEIHGRGPWIAFAHGAGGNHLSWWQQVPFFAPNFTCLTFDQRGWGRSECEGVPDPQRLGPDLAALLDHLGVERAALVGQSMGGWAVVGCALASPQRVSRLVLTGTLGGLTDDDMLAQLARLHHAEQFDGRLALAADFPEREPVRTFLFEQIAGLNPPLSPDVLRALVLLRYTNAVAKLEMPVCFIAGDRDRLFPLDLVEAARDKIPGAEIVIVPGSGHSVYFERSAEFNGALAAFLGAGAEP